MTLTRLGGMYAYWGGYVRVPVAYKKTKLEVPIETQCQYQRPFNGLQVPLRCVLPSFCWEISRTFKTTTFLHIMPEYSYTSKLNK